MIEEPARVAGSQVRLRPAAAVDTGKPGPRPWLGPVRERLEKHGLTARTADTGDEQGFGTTATILIATRG